jgi:Putative MetA-pathway of phenol degradation
MKSRLLLRIFVIGLFIPCVLGAQELIPAAYTPAPYGVNFVGLAVTSNRGDLAFDPSGPIDEAVGDITASSLTYARTLNLFKRSATATVILPYVVGDLEGLFLGEPAAANRSGTGDLAMRLGVNLLGGPAMSPREFATYRPKTLLGASLTVKAPTGQYDSTRLINIGTNRWSFKPEIGVVQVMGKWAIDAYIGAWFYTENSDFWLDTVRNQDPIYSSQVHVRYVFKRGLWAALDANYWYGGKATIDGVEGDDLQNNSRIGLTVSWQVARNHNLRFAVSRGAFTRIGGDFDSFGLSYGYTWAKRPG